MVVGELKHEKHEEQLIVGMQPLLSFFLHQRWHRAGSGPQKAQLDLIQEHVISTVPLPVSRNLFAQLSHLKTASYLTLQRLRSWVTSIFFPTFHF